MRCPVCKAPVVTYDDTGEEACSEDASHDFDEAEDSPWSIGSDGEANWALAKVKRARWELARIDEMVVYEIDRIRTRAAQIRRPHEASDRFFSSHLAAYLRAQQERGRAGKTYKLLNGDLKSRAGSTIVEVDEDTFRDWAEANARLDLLNIKVAPNKPAIKKALDAGEQIPGVTLAQNDDSYSVAVPDGEPPAFAPTADESEAA